jgi:ribosomal protein S18 acetylase RimI-like enzyme
VSSLQVEYCENPKLSARHIEQAADLAYVAFEDFYRLFSDDRFKMVTVIADQLRSFSELSQHLVCFQATRVVGFCSFYKSPEMSQRQMAGIRGLFSTANNIIESTKALGQYRKHFVAPSGDGVYISRFVIDKDLRGSGLAADLLSNAESIFQRNSAKQVRLHVRRHNEQALSFYVKAGYEPLENQGLGYMLLGKDLVL